MIDASRIETARGRARANFSEGFNCAECVFEALLATVETGLAHETIKLATGLGGGFGLYGDTCGALAGGILGIGAVHGRSELPPGADRQEVLARSKAQLYAHPGLYRVFNQLVDWFHQRFGETQCRALTAPWHARWLCREHALHCREIITETAGYAAELMLLSPQEISDLPFGPTVEVRPEPRAKPRHRSAQGQGLQSNT
jgi:C_GCAxxG_C_C family probable redox protein